MNTPRSTENDPIDGIAELHLSPDDTAVVLRLMAQAWNEGYVAGQAFGYEWAQDTYDGPMDDPTPNPYEQVIPPGGESDD